jgi:tetratricopeptide (TPR) repeat protein
MPKHAPAAGFPARTPARWGARRWQATIIFTLFFFAVAGAAAVGWWYARESPPHQGPIVVVSVDGLSSDAVDGPPGSSGLPAFDALVADSVIFDRAYSHSPQVLPAHASILTGQIPPQHGVRDDAGFALKDEARTMAELLRGRGFNTGAALTSPFLRRDAGIAQGFTFFSVNGTADDGTSAADAAERWARTQASQRYFLFMQVDRRDADAAIGRVTHVLKERRLYDGATVIVIGSRGKASLALDEATLRVPLVVKQPRHESAGRRITVPVQQVDVLPTILDFVRAPLPGGLAGRSLRKVIDGDTPLPPQPIYSESLAGYFRFGAAPQFAMTTERYRYLRGADDRVITLDGGNPIDEATAAPTLTALERIVSTHPLLPPGPIAPADEERLAAAGFLPGLPPPLEHTAATTGTIESSDEEKVADAEAAAARLVGERKFSAAVTTLQQVAREHPGLASVHYQLGMLLARSGRVDEAVGPLKDAAELRPDAVEVPLALADVLLRAGRLDEARETVDHAIEVAGEDRAAAGEAHALAARIALARKDVDEAAMHADAALAANPGLPMPQFVRGRMAFDDGHYDTALMAFREAAAVTREKGTAIPDLHLYIGRCLLHMEQYGEAETEFREELESFPRNLQAYGSLAMLYHAAGRDAEVEDVLNELVEAAPTPEGYGLAARLWMVLGERSRAEALKSDARARFRGDPSLALLGRDGHR